MQAKTRTGLKIKEAQYILIQLKSSRSIPSLYCLDAPTGTLINLISCEEQKLMLSTLQTFEVSDTM